MTEGEMIRMIRQVVRREITQTLMGTVTGTENSYVGSMQRFENEGEIEGLRLVFPYGFASRPPEDTQCVVGSIGGDASHLFIMGQFDLGNRPTLEEGETCLYGPQGQLLYFDAEGNMILGSYNAETGVVDPLFSAKFSAEGEIEFTNEVGTIKIDAEGKIELSNEVASATIDSTGKVTIENELATLELDASGAAKLENSIGSVEISASGTVDVSGPFVNIGEGASHGIGIGDNIENRLGALENKMTSFVTDYNTHIHSTTAPGAPTLPPLVPESPFIAIPLPAASVTCEVAS